MDAKNSPKDKRRNGEGLTPSVFNYILSYNLQATSYGRVLLPNRILNSLFFLKSSNSIELYEIPYFSILLMKKWGQERPPT